MKHKIRSIFFRPSSIIMLGMMLFVLINSAEHFVEDYLEIDLEHLETIIEEEDIFDSKNLIHDTIHEIDFNMTDENALYSETTTESHIL